MRGSEELPSIKFEPVHPSPIHQAMGLFSQPEPEGRVAGGKALHCLVCGNDRFYQREALLNTAATTFFDLDWANKSGTCFVCSKCGYIHWFLD